MPFRTTRFFAGFGPYGLLRYGIHKYRTGKGLDTYWKQSFANELQARARLREAIGGTVAMVLASAWAAKHSTADDDAGKEKFGVYFTGNGPSSRIMRDAWDKAGWKPYSAVFVIDGHKVPVPITRVGEALMTPFMLPAALDDAEWKKKEMMANGRKIPDPIKTAVGSIIGTHAAMLGQKGLLQGFSQMSQVMQGDQGTLKGIAKLAATSVSAATLPFKQTLASLSDMFVGPLDQSTASAIVANNFPIIGLPLQNKAINRFGDQLYDRSWYGRIYRTGIPVAFQVAENPENKALYETLLNAGAAPPQLLRSNLEDRYGVLTNEQFAQFAKNSGVALKQRVLDNLSSLKTMQPEEVKRFLTQAATQSDTETAESLGLERQKTARIALDASGGVQAPPARQNAPISQTGARTSAIRPQSRVSSSRRIRLTGLRAAPRSRLRSRTGRVRLGSRTKAAISRTPLRRRLSIPRNLRA